MYEIKVKGIEEAIKSIKNLEKGLNGKELMTMYAENGLEVVKDISSKSVNEDYLEISNYHKNHKIEYIKNDSAKLSNLTMADLSFLSDKTKLNYPDGFSISKAVEYGTGIVGARSQGSSQAEDWGYDLNNHGEKGWFYKKSENELRFTKGMSGKLVYYKASKEIEKNAQKWFDSFVEKKMK